MGQERKVEVDPNAGFCFGVEKAVQTAEELLEKGTRLFALGQMVHNKSVTSRLEQKGLVTIGVEDFNQANRETVLLRAHGEPPSTYKYAEENSIRIIDATCPIVLKLQQKIREKYLELDTENEQIVIFGKEGHPESIGLVGQTEGTAALVTNPEDLSKVETGKTIYLFSQTTMDPGEFDLLEENLRLLNAKSERTNIFSTCSICGQMKNRKPSLKAFASDKDLMIFVSGKNSSNGAMLYRYCKSLISGTYWIESAHEIDPDWFRGKHRIGISGATSTSKRELEEISEFIESLTID